MFQYLQHFVCFCSRSVSVIATLFPPEAFLLHLLDVFLLHHFCICTHTHTHTLLSLSHKTVLLLLFMPTIHRLRLQSPVNQRPHAADWVAGGHRSGWVKVKGSAKVRQVMVSSPLRQVDAQQEIWTLYLDFRGGQTPLFVSTEPIQS